MAAVVGSLAFGLGETRDPPPGATFDSGIEDDGNGALLTITHCGRSRGSLSLAHENGL